MKITDNTIAIEFNAVTVERRPFVMNRLKGNKILFSFYRNGSCALSHHRLQQLKKYSALFLEKGLEVVCVFESLPKDTYPFTGSVQAPFTVLADPMALLYDMYVVENAENKIRNMMAAGLLTPAINAAAKAGFPWIPQEGSNFFRMPADFLIDEDFIIRKAHYASTLTDHLTVEEILEWLHKSKPENKPVFISRSYITDQRIRKAI